MQIVYSSMYGVRNMASVDMIGLDPYRVVVGVGGCLSFCLFFPKQRHLNFRCLRGKWSCT